MQETSWSESVDRIVFVHGAWHDHRCWEPVIDELDKRDVSAVAVDLPAEDPEAGIDDYVEVVTRAIGNGPGARNVAVVAHSFGGLILPVVASRHQLAAILYLAALVPEPGVTFNDQVRKTPDMFAPEWRSLSSRQVRNSDGSSSWPADAAIEALYHDCEPSVAVRAASQLRPQHWQVADETCPLTEHPEVPTRYIACRHDRSIGFDWSARTARDRLGIAVEVMDSSHSPMLSKPDELAAQLLV